MRPSLLLLVTTVSLLPALPKAQAQVRYYDGYNRNAAAAEDRNRATRAATAEQQRQAAATPRSSSSPNAAQPSAPAYDPTLNQRLEEAQAQSAAREYAERQAAAARKTAAIEAQVKQANAGLNQLRDMLNSPAMLAAEKQRLAEEANKERIVQLRLPYQEARVREGFTTGEGQAMALRDLRYDAGSQQMVALNDPAVAAVRQAYGTFVAQRGTASLEELLALVRQFEPAGYTALRELRALATRFPARQRELELAELHALPFALGHHQATALREKDRMIEAEDIKGDVLNRFEALSAKYPAEAQVAATECYDGADPYSQLAWYAKRRDDYPAAASYYRQMLEVPFGAHRDGNDVYWNRFYNAYNVFTHKGVKNPLAKLQEADWVRLARLQGIPVAFLMGQMLFDTPLYGTLQRNRSNPYTARVHPDFVGSKYGKMLRHLAETGDAQALNDYAVLVAGGKVPGQAPAQALPMLEQAAAGGSIYAAVNLSWATTWGLPGYADQAAGRAKLETYLAKASPADLVLYARILSGYHFSGNLPFDRPRARELAQQVLAAGLPEGPELVKDLENLK